MPATFRGMKMMERGVWCVVWRALAVVTQVVGGRGSNINVCKGGRMKSKQQQSWKLCFSSPFAGSSSVEIKQFEELRGQHSVE